MSTYSRKWFDEFLRGYFSAALWSSTDDQDQHLDANYDRDDLAESTRLHQIISCHDFITANLADLNELDASQCGHDFWLTRCGHGTGFWDRGYGDLGDRLAESSRAFKNVDLYVGDDKKLYVMGGERMPSADELAKLPPALTEAEIARLRYLWTHHPIVATPVDQGLVAKGYAKQASDASIIPDVDSPIFAFKAVNGRNENDELMLFIRIIPNAEKTAALDAGALTP